MCLEHLEVCTSPHQRTRRFVVDMRIILTRFTIVIFSLITLINTIVAKDEDDDDDDDDNDDVAMSKINNLLSGSSRRTKLESSLSDFFEFNGRESPTKRLIVRENGEEDNNEADGISSTDLVDKDDDGGQEESVEYVREDEEDANEDTTKKNLVETKTSHGGLARTIGRKLMDRKTKFTISLPVAIVAVGSIIILSCCCSLYLRSRLVACVNRLPGRRRKKKSGKMLAVDTERGRSTPRSKKRREKSISLSRRRARSLSRDMVNIATQNSPPTTRDVDEKSSTTGCYRCCKKKNKKKRDG